MYISIYLSIKIYRYSMYGGCGLLETRMALRFALIGERWMNGILVDHLHRGCFMGETTGTGVPDLGLDVAGDVGGDG